MTLAIVSVMAMNGAITVGTYVAYSGMVVLIIWPMRNLGRLVVEMSRGLWSVFAILAKAADNASLDGHPEEFSGGFQVRLNLAKVLVSEPDLLLLDEPTNYLDITSIRWISGFLRSWPREILLVTHDRSFMDSVVTHIAGIHRTVVRKIEVDQVAQGLKRRDIGDVVMGKL